MTTLIPKVSLKNGGSTPTGAINRPINEKLNETVSVLDFGAVGDGVTNNYDAFNNAIKTGKIVYVPSGVYYINSPITISNSTTIIGNGVNSTLIYRNFTGTSFGEGVFNFVSGANGSTVDNMGIISQTGTTGGCLISLIADANGGPDFCKFSNLYLTSNNSDDWKIWIDGSARTTGAIGVRDTFITNCSVFGGANGAIYANGAIALHINATDTFPAGGTSGKITITGTTAVKSYYVTVEGSSIHGFSLDNLIYLNVRASVISGDITNASSADSCIINATTFGAVQQNWVNSIVYNNTGTVGTFTGQNSPIQAFKKSGSITTIGQIGVSQSTVCANGTETFNFICEPGKLFHIATGGGAAALVFADYKSNTITLLANPSNEFEATALTPTVGKTGIYKDLNSNTIYIRSNVGVSTTYSILTLGNVTSTSDPT